MTESPTTGPALTPQQRLENLRTEVQNARNAPPVTPDRRTNLQSTLNALRSEASSLNQTDLDRLDEEIQNLPTPPPPPEPSISDALITAGLPLDPAQRRQLEQATGTFDRIKRGIFMFLRSVPFLRNWAQRHLRAMGMTEYANELRSPEEKKKAEDEKRKKDDEAKKQESGKKKAEAEQQRVKSLQERIRENPNIEHAIHAYALARAMRSFAPSLPVTFTPEQERLDLAGTPTGGNYHYRTVTQSIVNWLKAESGRPIFGLEIDGGDLEEADGSNIIRDNDLIVNFEAQLRDTPKVAFLNLRALRNTAIGLNSTAQRMLPQLIAAMDQELAQAMGTQPATPQIQKAQKEQKEKVTKEAASSGSTPPSPSTT